MAAHAVLMEIPTVIPTGKLFAMCILRSVSHFGEIRTWARENKFDFYALHDSSAMTGAIMNSADSFAVSTAICGMTYFSRSLQLYCFISVET